METRHHAPVMTPVAASEPNLLGSLRLACPARPELFSRFRACLQAFLLSQLADPDVHSRCMMVAHELLENILKYSDPSTTPVIEVAVAQRGDLGVVEIRTVNRTSPEHLDELRARLLAVTEATDPNLHYDRLIAESAQRSQGSGLGLGRISAEGEMKVSYQVHEDQVTISALTTFPAGRAP